MFETSLCSSLAQGTPDKWLLRSDVPSCETTPPSQGWRADYMSIGVIFSLGPDKQWPPLIYPKGLNHQCFIGVRNCEDPKKNQTKSCLQGTLGTATAISGSHPDGDTL